MPTLCSELEVLISTSAWLVQDGWELEAISIATGAGLPTVNSQKVQFRDAFKSKIAGKTAVVFCTYSGPHTGIKEVTPVGDYLGQFFEHIGFDVAAKWYVVGEFNGREDYSTKGKLGDVRGRPNQQDLSQVETLRSVS